MKVRRQIGRYLIVRSVRRAPEAMSGIAERTNQQATQLDCKRELGASNGFHQRVEA